MTYWYILAGIWTLLAISWSIACLQSDAEGGKPSKLERFIQSKEALVEAYKRDAS